MKKVVSATKEQAKRKALEGFARAVDRAYGNWWHLITRSFVGGLFVALGATVGFALLVTILIFVLRHLEVLPVVGDFFSNIKDFVQEANTNASL